MEKNNEPNTEYRIIKKLLSSIKKILLFKIIFIPVIIRLNGIKKDISPIDWKKRSEVKLPRKPRIFLISVFCGKIKFGSSGEKLIRESINKVPSKSMLMPRISINLLIVKFIALLANFFISINQWIELITLYHLIFIVKIKN